MGVGAVFGDVGTVHVEDVLGLLADVGELGYAGLHLEREFVLGDAGLDFGVAVILMPLSIQLGNVVENATPMFGGHSGRIVEIQHGIAITSEPDTLIFGWQESAAPIVVVEQLTTGFFLVGAGHDDKAGQFVGHVSEAVGCPCAHARSTRNLVSGEEVRHARRVIDRLGVHRVDEGDFVADAAGKGEEFAEPHAGFSVLFERLDGGENGELCLTCGHGR